MKSGGFHLKSGRFREIRWISGEIHPEPYKFRCFNKNYSVWWMQERGYDLGFHEIWGHSPFHAPPPNWRVFAATSEFIRFGVDFTWNPPDFMRISCEIERPLARNCNPMFYVLCMLYLYLDVYNKLEVTTLGDLQLYHGPECVRHKTQKFDLYTTDLNTKFIYFSHNFKTVQKHSFKKCLVWHWTTCQIFLSKKTF